MSTNNKCVPVEDSHGIAGLDRTTLTLLKDLRALFERMSVVCDTLKFFTKSVSAISRVIRIHTLLKKIRRRWNLKL